MAFWSSRPFHGSSGIALAQIQDPDGARVYLFRVIAGDRAEEVKSFVGLLLRRSYVRELFMKSLGAGRRNGAEGQPVLAVFESGRQVLASPGWAGQGETRTPAGGLFPLWEVAAGYGGTTIEAAARVQFRRSLALAVLAVLGLGLGAFVTLTTAGREAHLAQMKTAFVSNVSHEMKTPLALIRMYAETLEAGRVAAPEKMREYHQVIHRESRRLTGLIDNVLDFARLDAGSHNFRFEAIDVGRLASDLASAFEERLRAGGFRLAVDIEAGLPPVAADRVALSQALANLIDNAAKYSAGARDIHIAVRRNDTGVAVEVKDHGIGIPGFEQGRIFEKFYRVEDPLVRETRGAGLGLTLSKQIVEAHQGRIEVRSAAGCGSTFTVLLPAAASVG